MTSERDGAAPRQTGSGFGAALAGARRTGGLVMIAAVVLLAFNLRPAVNALGVVIPEIQQEIGISGTVAGLLLALPTLCFALMGFTVSRLAARMGAGGAVLAAIVALVGGQLLRATVDGLWALFAGSVIALAAIAVGNVLLPGLIRAHFPTAIGPMTALYTTVLMIGQTAGAGLTLPLQEALGGTWRLGIGMWAVTAAVALLPWIVAVARSVRSARERISAAGGSSARTNRVPGVFALIRSRHAWAMAIFFGMQSLQAYVVFGWIPAVLTNAGISQSAAGGVLAIITAMGIPISALVPSMLGVIKRQDILVIAFVSATALGYTALMLIPTVLPWLQGILIGFGLGAFPMALTLMALRARTPGGTTNLSAFGQSVGYLLASVGPVGFGILHDLSGGFEVPLIAMLVTLVPMLIGGLIVVRDWHIEDDLPAAA